MQCLSVLVAVGLGLGLGLVHIYSRVLSGVKFCGEPKHLFIHNRYVYMHAHLVQHKHVYSLILKTTLIHAACISVFL